MSSCTPSLLQQVFSQLAGPDLSRRSFSEGGSYAFGMLPHCAVLLTWWGNFNSSFILHPSSFPPLPVCPGIALLLAPCLAARPLPPDYGLGDGAKPPENRQNLPVDAFHQLWQDGPGMNESEKQFSFTRAAPSTSGCARKQFLISFSSRSTQATGIKLSKKEPLRFEQVSNAAPRYMETQCRARRFWPIC